MWPAGGWKNELARTYAPHSPAPTLVPREDAATYRNTVNRDAVCCSLTLICGANSETRKYSTPTATKAMNEKTSILLHLRAVATHFWHSSLMGGDYTLAAPPSQ